MKQSSFAGILCGLATVAYVTLSKTTIGGLFPFFPQWVQDINVGIIALIINLAVTLVVSLATRRATTPVAMPEEVAVEELSI